MYHSGLGGAANYLNLNDTFATGTSSNIFNSTAPTSSVFSVGTDLSPSGEDMIAYLWADCDGYSKFGSYTGNGSSTNAITGLGFQPDWLMIKNSTDDNNDWQIYDSKRGDGQVLLANKSDAEANNSSNFGS